jgi:hypothetical protein
LKRINFKLLQIEIKPGKLNLSHFDNITTAVGRLNLSKPLPAFSQRVSIEPEVAGMDIGTGEYGQIKVSANKLKMFSD